MERTVSWRWETRSTPRSVRCVRESGRGSPAQSTPGRRGGEFGEKLPTGDDVAVPDTMNDAADGDDRVRLRMWLNTVEIDRLDRWLDGSISEFK